MRDDAEAVEDVGDDALALGLLHVAVGERQLDVLVDGQVVEQVVALEHEADVALLQRRAILLASAWMGCPSKQYSPLQALSCMPRMWSSVDLPAPDGPMIETNSPGLMSSAIRRSTKVCPAPTGNDFSTPFSDMSGAVGSSCGGSVRAEERTSEDHGGVSLM